MSLSMLTHQVVLHPAASATLKVASTTVGRDKLYRTIQYFARFYAYFLSTRPGASKESIARWSALKTALAQSRKLMRVGKWLEHLQAAVKGASNQDTVLKVTSVGRQLGLAAYMVQDTLIWLHAVKVKTWQPSTYARLQKEAARAWLIGISFSLLSGIYKRGKIHAGIAAAKSSNGPSGSPEKEVERRTQLSSYKAQAYANNYQMAQDVLDWMIPATSIGLLNLSDGTLGIVGLITSLMGLKTQTTNVLGAGAAAKA